MCLSTILKYSPRTLKRLKNLIRGREAYIITQVPHNDDIFISDYLNVPVMCPEPDTAALFSCKSGSKRIFANAGVTMPPGEYDVYSLPQLHECLAQLITENLEVTRWLFKLDDEYDGRGIAYIDIGDHLHCYQWALKEAARYGEKWKKKWAQEAAYIKIHEEVPTLLTQHARTNNKNVYATWEIYLEAFLSQGGVIEACPPSDSVTALTADMLIEPNGEMSIVSLGDQIHDDSLYTCWGLSVPQSSVEPELLNDNLFKVAESCRARGVIGYFAVDFVTFIHPKTMAQELWTVDLNLSYSDTAAMSQLLKFVSCGTLDVKTHFFDVPPPKVEEKKLRRRRLKEEEAPPNTKRYAVLSTKLFHTNLSVVHYSVFFQMCRAHGIGYDIKEKQGTVFTLIDSFNREHLGMLSVGDNLQNVLSIFATNLSVIHQEISAPNMQGDSNFRPVIEDIEAILGTTVENAEDEEEDKEEEKEVATT
ncbi:hypothetical protein NP493_102g04043 [Ridgeia piscesae]|uniref:IQCH-like ATP-grasp domain-containing protein n=1 Tax=Ridgeia piscesae TaxID=27915 RepID=A0AAD9UHH9_RIDPI|nr:hypothetical protein NP493_102g04043 [Ridgeia piscesae]